MRIAIIGTGVAGSLLAEGLLAHPGITVTAFERARLGEHAEAGTGLNVGPNALRALRLHAPARHAALRAVSVPWQRWTVDLANGTPLLDLDVAEIAGEPGARLRWSELYRVLRTPIAAATRGGLALAALEEDAAGRLVPVFSTLDGEHVCPGAFDLMVGADGRYSRTRALAAGGATPELTGLCLWRLLVPDAADSRRPCCAPAATRPRSRRCATSGCASCATSPLLPPIPCCPAATRARERGRRLGTISALS